MISRFSLIGTSSLAAILSPLMASSALAWTGDEVAQRLQALLKQQSISISYSKIETDGKEVIIHAVKAGIATEDDQSINLGDLTLSDISEDNNGDYLIGIVALADTKIIEDSSIFSSQGVRLNNLQLAKEPKNDFLSRLNFFSDFNIDQLRISSQGVDVFRLEKFFVQKDAYSPEKPSAFSWGFNALDINIKDLDSDEFGLKKAGLNLDDDADNTPDEAVTDAGSGMKSAVKIAPADEDADILAEDELPDADTADDVTEEEIPVEKSDEFKMLKELGFEKLHISMDTKGSWSPYSGDYKVDNMLITVDKIGKFNYSMHMGGYDLQLIKGLEAAYGTMMTTGTDNTSLLIAAYGLLQNLSISSMEMRFDDADFVTKFLDYDAKDRDITRQQLIDELKEQLAQGVAFFEQEPLVVQAAKAAGDFLDNPKSLAIHVKPENPVSFSVLSAVGMAEPKKVWSLLGVQVEANR